MNALEVKNLSKSFGNIEAVKNVSFAVPEGSIFGLIGRNGAGKTTTIRMMMNIFEPDSGEVVLRGTRVGQEFRNNVGYLPEERGLYKKMKIIDLLMFFAEIKGKKGREIKDQALSYLEKFSLLDRKSAKIEDLSKGNQQKVQFIATILHEPDFIILDEPFTGLDPINTNILKEIILQLKEKGKVIILSTHLMDFAERMCDHIAMINKGEIIMCGAMSELKKKHGKNNVTVSFEGDVSFVESLSYVEKVTHFGNSISVKMADEKDAQKLLAEMTSRQIVVNHFSTNEISLQELFVNHAGSEEVAAEKEVQYV